MSLFTLLNKHTVNNLYHLFSILALISETAAIYGWQWLYYSFNPFYTCYRDCDLLNGVRCFLVISFILTILFPLFVDRIEQVQKWTKLDDNKKRYLWLFIIQIIIAGLNGIALFMFVSYMDRIRSYNRPNYGWSFVMAWFGVGFRVLAGVFCFLWTKMIL